MNEVVVSFGEALWDMLPGGVVLGGAPLNLAYRMHTLGLESYLFSMLGVDDLGKRALGEMIAKGMPINFVYSSGMYPTGTVTVHLDEDKNPSYTIERDTAYDHIPLTEKNDALASRADVICFGTLAQRDPESRYTLKRLLAAFTGKFCLYDINLRKGHFSIGLVQQSLEKCNVLKMNDDELLYLNRSLPLGCRDMREAALRLKQKFRIAYVVVTMGEKGAFGIDAKDAVYIEAGYDMKKVDPCGAGDAFTAAFMRSLLREHTMDQALRYGNALGGLVSGQPGATQPITSNELEEYLHSAGRTHIDERDFII